jgi:hypothetical protein
MAEDKEILKEVWDGRIPVCFKLAQDECCANEPDEFYVSPMRPRLRPHFLFITKTINSQADGSKADLLSTRHGQGAKVL